jgi:hypothetical protein
MSDDEHPNEDTENRFDNFAEVYEALDTANGQGYFEAAFAADILRWWADAVTDDFAVIHLPAVDEGDDISGGEAVLALERALAEQVVLAANTRGLSTAAPWTPLVTMRDVSATLVRAMGEEPSTGRSLGAGAEADEAHKGNMATINEWLEERDALPESAEA